MSVTLHLSGDEALVLFEWLALRERSDAPMAAEDVVLNRVFGQLESALVEPFDANYSGLLEAARLRLIEND